ncbi:MAG: hypothetical protein J0I06_18100 [Planctomycetes bacterium]|nr:hypothetical protein [Planctomycetota bacterium]
MDELIKTVSERAGINPEQAKLAVASVVDFVKGKLPLLGEQVQGLITGCGEGENPLAGAADAIKKRFGF